MTRARTLDHFVIVVGDLQVAADQYRRLGFHVRPVARHIEIGSSNCVVHLPSTYLELFCPGDSDHAILEPYRAHLEIGEGLAHVSLDSVDLESDHRLMGTLGLAPDPIVSARRKIVRPDGSPDETASSFFYMWRNDNRYLSLFLSEHRRPDAIFIPEFEDHPNAAAEVSRVVYVSRDPAGDVDYFSRIFGKQPDSRDAAGFSIVGARGDVTEVLSVDVARGRYGPSLRSQELGPLQGAGVALHFSTHSLERCEKHLSSTGVGFERGRGGLIVPASEACGCIAVFHA